MKTEVDDWLTELPPLDGGDDEPDTGDDIGDEPLPEAEDGSSLDDATAEDLDVGVDIPDEEGVGQEPREDDEAWEADVGEPELDVADGEATSEADGEPQPAEGEFDNHDDLPSSDDDAGEEGTTDPIEHSLDEELPAMDADDEGDFEDKLLLETTAVWHDPDSLRWADAAWSECSSLARSSPWTADESDPLVRMALLTGDEVVAAVAESGALWVSSDGGRTAFHKRAGGQQLRAAFGASAVFVAWGASAGGGRALWVANGGGQLARSEDLGETFRACAGVGRPVLALATREDGSLFALTLKGAVVELLTSADGEIWFSQRVSGDIAALTSPAAPRVRWMTCRGAAVAVGDDQGALWSRDGRHFVRVPATVGASAGVFAGPGPRAPLILCGSFGGDELHLVRVPHDSPAEIVAELPALPEGDVGDRVLGLLWLEDAGAVRVVLRGAAVVWSPPPAVAPLNAGG